MISPRIFETQREACEFYGHCWKWITNHYKVSVCVRSQGRKSAYAIYAII